MFKLLFDFKGAIGRLAYLGGSALIMALGVGLLVVLSIGMVVLSDGGSGASGFRTKGMVLGFVVFAAAVWPSTVLSVKRLRDLRVDTTAALALCLAPMVISLLAVGLISAGGPRAVLAPIQQISYVAGLAVSLACLALPSRRRDGGQAVAIERPRPATMAPVMARSQFGRRGLP